MTVTAQIVYVEHIGGPYDGFVVAVQADPDGNPPESYLMDIPGPIDVSVDPGSAAIAKGATGFYDRDTRIRDNGPCWVFVFRGEDSWDIAA